MTPDITVTTHRNGYELRIEGDKNEYMYFSLPKLMMGIAQHCQDNISKENCEMFAECLQSNVAPTEHFLQMLRKEQKAHDATTIAWKQALLEVKTKEGKIQLLNSDIEVLKLKIKNLEKAKRTKDKTKSKTKKE